MRKGLVFYVIFCLETLLSGITIEKAQVHSMLKAVMYRGIVILLV